MNRKLLYIICEIARRKAGRLEGVTGTPVKVEELLNLLHDLWVVKRVAIASDYHQVLSSLEYMDEVLGWIEFDADKDVIRVTGEGLREYKELLRRGYYPFVREVTIWV